MCTGKSETKGEKTRSEKPFFDSTINFFVTFFLAFLKISHDAKSTDRISQLLEIETSKKVTIEFTKTRLFNDFETENNRPQ